MEPMSNLGPSCHTSHVPGSQLRSRLHSRPLVVWPCGCGHNGKEAIQSILRSNIPNGPLASVSESAGRSVQRFYTLSFSEIFSSGPFSAKLFSLFTCLQLRTTSEFFTFRYATPLRSEERSSCAKLLPLREIGIKNTLLLPFGIILAPARASTKKEEKLCLEKD